VEAALESKYGKQIREYSKGIEGKLKKAAQDFEKREKALLGRAGFSLTKKKPVAKAPAKKAVAKKPAAKKAPAKKAAVKKAPAKKTAAKKTSAKKTSPGA